MSSAFAQNEVMRERNSLYGITQFGVVVNIEKPLGLDEFTIEVDSVRSLLLDELETIPVTILSDETLRQSDQYPLLHLHINIMRAGSGLYPFSAELTFYQPAKLPLNNDIQTTASTWHDSLIGIVSPDMFHVIAEQAAKLANVFRRDFEYVN